MIYMNSKPGNDPRLYLALREYERFVDTMFPTREPKQKRFPRVLVDLLEDVAKEMGVGVKGMLSRSRRRNIVLARIVFCRRAVALGKFSTPQIARVINRHHTTVCYFAGLLKQKQPDWIDEALRDIRV